MTITKKMQYQDVMLFYIGFASIISQILLIREFLASFYGNELSIGVIFACWMLWTGSGSMLGNRFLKKKKIIDPVFSVLLALAPVLTVLQIAAVKFAHAFFSPEAGEYLSMSELSMFSFIVLSAGCVLWGMLFSFGARLLGRKQNVYWSGINRAYLWELLGSVSGGLIFSFVFASILTSLQTVSLLVLLALILVVFRYGRKIIILTALPAVISVVWLSVFGTIKLLESRLDAYKWSFINDRLTFLQSIDTKYQNLSLLRLKDQYTVYADGRPSYSIPNTYDAEVFVHSVLVHYPEAKRIMVLGGGFNGLLNEILKYPVREIDYVEIDPALVPFVEPILDREDLKALRNEKVKLVNEDGSEYLKKKGRMFDVILLNITEPYTAGLNRFFTKEFFMLCASRLSDKGLCAFSFPSSAEYIADEMRDLDASLYRTFGQVFGSDLIIPGTHAVLVGSKTARTFVSNPDSLAGIYKYYGIKSKYFSGYMYEDLMQKERIDYVRNVLGSANDVRLNTDLNPITYYFDFLLWNRIFHDGYRYFAYLTRNRIMSGAVILAAVLLIIFVFKRNLREKKFLKFTIACCGFTGMALNLLVLLNYQTAFGSVYEMLGVMVAVNMLGMAAGAVVPTIIHRDLKKPIVGALLLLVVFILLLPVILDLLLSVHSIVLTSVVILCAGGFSGFMFGTVSRLYNSPHTGTIYAYDLFGSSVGALMICSVLLPVLGIYETSYFLAILLFPILTAGIIYAATE